MMQNAIELDELVAEEQKLIFPYFDTSVAWTVGCRLRDRAISENFPIAIELSVGGKPLFFSSLSGATPDNGEWIRRKRNVVDRFHRSSFFFAVQEQQQGRPFLERFNLCGEDYCAKGGGVPILLCGIGAIGALSVSGLPHQQDHRMVVNILRESIASLGTAKNLT